MNSQERKLIQSCIKGKQTAQTQLYDQYAPRLFGICMRYANNKEDAEDILQQGFFKIFRDLNQFDFKSHVFTWMRTVMVNTALMHLRKQGGLNFSILGLERLNIEEAPKVVAQLEAEAILQCIRKLPNGFRTIFNLYVIEDFSHKEIAQLLNISEGTSRSQYARARKALQHIMIRDFGSVKL